MSWFNSWFEDPADKITRVFTLGAFGADDLPYIGDSRKAERNYQEQKKVQKYQEQLQERIFQREDSSLQRRVEDAVLAGLNPQLALSGGAGTGQAIPLNVPQKQSTPNMLDALSTAINFKTGLASLRGQNLANEASKMNLEWFKKNNLPTTANGDYVSMLQAIGSLLEGIKGNSGGVVTQTKGLISEAVGRAKEAMQPVSDSLERIAPPSGDVSTGVDFSFKPSGDIVNDGFGDTKALKSEVGKTWQNIKNKASNFWEKIKPKPLPTSGLMRQGYRKKGNFWVKK